MSIQASLNQLLGLGGQIAFQATAPERFAQAQSEEKAKKAAEFQETLAKREKAADIELDSAIDKAIKNEDYEAAATAMQKKVDIARSRFENDPTAENWAIVEQLSGEEGVKGYQEAAEQVRLDKQIKSRLMNRLDTINNQQAALKERADYLKSLPTKDIAKSLPTKDMIEEIVSRGEMSSEASKRYIKRAKKGEAK